MATALVTRAEHLCHGGQQGFYEHPSEACGGPARFSVFLPPHALEGQKVPAVYFLAGAGGDETVLPERGQMQMVAASLGLAVVACASLGSPFYLDATRGGPRLETHVVSELPVWLERYFPIGGERRGICGHSSGGHAALAIALRHPVLYSSVSAFAPVVAASQVPWGKKAFNAAIGDDPAAWAALDACELVRRSPRHGTLLVDFGTSDPLLDTELRPELLEAACAASGQSLLLRRQDGYDHGYYFVASFMAEHLRHHARALQPSAA